MDYELRNYLLPIKDYYSITEKVFAARGIPPENLNHYFNTTDEDILDPLLLDNVENGIKLIAKHIKNNSPTIMVVDPDCDGYTSSALFLNYLNHFFPSYVQNNINYLFHEGKQHGLNDMLNKIPDNIKLVICLDSSSNDYEAHKILKDKGCDLFIADHHEAEEISENAIVINNQLCNYPNKTLSGVGVIYKVCEQFDKYLNSNYADNLLDLVAVGLCGDMMSLKEFETHHLITKGLQNIQNPFIKQMSQVQNYSISKAGGLCPFSVSFYIVPQVNGTIRMGTPEEKKMLFESMLEFKAYERIPSTKRGHKGEEESLVEQACRNCTNIKRNQAKEVENSLNIIENIIQNKNLLNNKIIAVKLDKDHSINRNLTGLVGNQLMSKYKHPILILSETEENGEKAWAGSGRGYDAKGFNSLKDFLQDSGLVYLAQGHAQALGVGITDSKFDEFITYSNKALEKCTFNPCTKVDFIWSSSQDFNSKDIVDLASLNTVWGQELEKPYLALENFLVAPAQITLMSRDKNPTLKIQLSNGVELIKFKSSEEEFDLLTQNPYGSVSIDAVGTASYNEWNGQITGQIILDDYEVVGENKYYF